MVPEQLLKDIVEAPNAVTDHGVAASEKFVSEAEAILSKSRRSLAADEQHLSSLNKRQGQVNRRLVELGEHAGTARAESLKAVIADPKCWKGEHDKRAGFEAEIKILTEALEFLVAGEISDAGISIRKSTLAVALATREYVSAKARFDISQLWRDMRTAMKRDPTLSLNVNKGGMVWSYAQKLNQIEAEIREHEEKLAGDIAALKNTRQRLGYVTLTTNNETEEQAA